MIAFVDTSAFFAVLDRDDNSHREAARTWPRLLEEYSSLLTTNYVLVETNALVQRRLGMEAVNVFNSYIVPVTKVHWVDEVVHRDGSNALLTANRRELSLVDCVSFAVMRGLGVQDYFGFDSHFDEQGFRPVVMESDR